MSKKLWERIGVCSASLFVFFAGGYGIASDNYAVINNALGIETSEIDRSDDPQYEYFKNKYGKDEYAKLQEDFLEVGKKVEGEGLVLLKNENEALPFAKTEKVSCVFTGSNVFNYGSSGSSSANTENYTDLKTALTKVGFSVNNTLWNFYNEKLASGYGRECIGTLYKTNEVPYSEYTQQVKDSFSEYDTVLVNIARNSGEGKDISTSGSDGEDGTYLSLTKEEVGVLQELTELKKSGTIKKIVVMLNSSATIQLDFLQNENIDVDACMWIGNVGKSGIDAVADVLVGNTVPSGKLSDTYLNNNFASPAAAQQYWNDGKRFASAYTNITGSSPEEVVSKYYGVYTEGIYVGYRYFETRYYDYVTGAANVGEYAYANDVAYSFGYGKSYTDFEYSDFEVKESKDGTMYEVSVTVTNVGSTYSGKEAVEIYLQKPYTEYDKEWGVEKAAVELVAYDKTEILAPGSSQTLTMTVSHSQFKSYDADSGAYIVDAGDYYLTAANGAHEAVNNILAAQGKTVANTEGKMDEDGDANLVASVNQAVFDMDTYAYSEYNSDYLIENQLDFADYNKYSGTNTITYLSRSNWVGTFPSSADAKIVLTATDQMKADLKSNKGIEEDKNATMPTYGADNGLTLVQLRGKSYDDPMWDELLDQMTFEEQSLLVTTGQMMTVEISSIAKPNTVESDGPTGIADSKGDLSLPSEGIWASSMNDELIYEVGEMLAEDAIACGKTGVYANAINIHRTAFGGRSHEYFSEDPYLTGQASVYEVRGIQSKGIIAVVKHFIFNDQEDQRAGVGVWLNEQEAREIMLAPFVATLSKSGGNAAAVMTSFNRAGTDWVGANKNLMDNILHGEIGFEGYNITDMAVSDAAVIMNYEDGLSNGTNLFLATGSETALSAYKDNATMCQRIRESSHRILYSVCNYSRAMNGMTPETGVSTSMEWWRILILAVDGIFGVLTVSSAVMYLFSRKEK